MQLTATITVNFTNQDIDDIMSTALEGGITYWCGEAEVDGDYLGEYASDQISRGGTLILHDIESDECFELTREKFIKGLTQFITESPCTGIGEYGNLDTSEIDADAADCIVQLALFGEIVYG